MGLSSHTVLNEEMGWSSLWSGVACYPALFPRMELNPWWGWVHHFVLLPGMSCSGRQRVHKGLVHQLALLLGNELVTSLRSPSLPLRCFACNELIRSANCIGSGWSLANMDVEETDVPPASQPEQKMGLAFGLVLIEIALHFHHWDSWRCHQFLGLVA